MPIVQQFLAFAAVGGIGTGVHYALFVLLVAEVGLAPVVATSVGAVAGALVNFALNYRVTFSSRTDVSRALRRFMAVAALGWLVNAAVVEAAIELVHAHYLVAQVIATAVVLVLGYTMHRTWTFREEDRASR